MNTPLLSHRFRRPGAVLTLIGMTLGFIHLFGEFEEDLLSVPVFAIYSADIFEPSSYFTIIHNNIIDEVALILSVVGLTLLVFSAEKKEDEFTLYLRLRAIMWAVGVNSIILLVATLFIYDLGFFYVLIGNCLTVLILAVLRFRWLIYTSNRHEE